MQKKYIAILALILCTSFADNIVRKSFSKREYLVYKATMLYSKKKYSHSLKFLEKALPMFRLEAAQLKFLIYKIAMANFFKKNYKLAGQFFNNCYRTYSKDLLTEASLFRSAYCYYLYVIDSGNNFDKTYAHIAIKESQNFINRYPNSNKINQAKIILKVLIEKLTEKAFNNALRYYKLALYKAVIISFREFINDYPYSSLKEKAYLYILNSHYKLAICSPTENLQGLRLEDAMNIYSLFKENYNSSYDRKIGILCKNYQRLIIKIMSKQQ